MNELGWKPEKRFEDGIKSTVEWYLENELWLESITSGKYLDYHE
jgi:dTDP-glucose 4,6-dehydratase